MTGSWGCGLSTTVSLTVEGYFRLLNSRDSQLGVLVQHSLGQI